MTNTFLKGLFAAAASSALAVAQHQASKQGAKKRKGESCTPCAAHAYVDSIRPQTQGKKR